LFVTVAKYSLYQSSVYCKSSEAEGNFMHKVYYRWDLRCSGTLRRVDW